MEKMAHAFNTTVSNLEDELSQLILDGQIQARIDSHNKVKSFTTTVKSLTISPKNPFHNKPSLENKLLDVFRSSLQRIMYLQF